MGMHRREDASSLAFLPKKFSFSPSSSRPGRLVRLASSPDDTTSAAGKLGMASDKSLGASASVADWTIEMPDGTSVRFSWSTAGQHTLTWSDTIRVRIDDHITALLPGSCNLYNFPTVQFLKSTHIQAEEQDGLRLQVLVDLITAIATGSGLTRGDGVLGQSPFDLPDDSGATPILALLVANTAPAISLCLQLYRARPELLAHSHAPGANNAFTGENAFHVAAVNRREDALCTMLELAHDGLDALPQCLFVLLLNLFL